MPHSNISAVTRKRARSLRYGMTSAERCLWRALRALKPQGAHFRRQAPIGRFVADFACLGNKLLIEVDGSQHAEPDAEIYDRERTRWLEEQGFRVLRFWNNDVLTNTAGVVDAIIAELERIQLARRTPS